METHAFSIEMNANAFNVLSDKLYEDKPLACIREYASNAYDAHIEAGQKRPFDVQLPTQLKPEFVLRDYGISMDKETVLDRYIRFFSSSKGATRKQAGRFGLGCKAAFSYTNTFSVVTWHGGIKTTFAARMNEIGEPEMIVTDERPSSEPRGVEIKFPVRGEDVLRFKRAAYRALFPMRDACTITPPLDWPDITLETPDKSVQFFEKSNYLHESVYIQMACVIYPVDLTKLDYDTKRNLRRGSGFCVIHVPKGSFDIAASRETLSYDPTTIKAASDKIQELKDKYQAEYDAELGDNPGLISIWNTNKKWASNPFVNRRNLNPKTNKYSLSTMNINGSGLLRKTYSRWDILFDEDYTVFGMTGKTRRLLPRIKQYLATNNIPYDQALIIYTADAYADWADVVASEYLPQDIAIDVATLPKVPRAKSGGNGGVSEMDAFILDNGTISLSKIPVAAARKATHYIVGRNYSSSQLTPYKDELEFPIAIYQRMPTKVTGRTNVENKIEEIRHRKAQKYTRYHSLLLVKQNEGSIMGKLTDLALRGEPMPEAPPDGSLPRVFDNGWIKHYTYKFRALKKRYPLLADIAYAVDEQHVREYISLMDQKGN